VDEASTVVSEDDEYEEQPKRNRRHDDRSAAIIWLAWLARKVRHVWDGGRGCRRMYLATVDWLTEIPSF